MPRRSSRVIPTPSSSSTTPSSPPTSATTTDFAVNAFQTPSQLDALVRALHQHDHPVPADPAWVGQVYKYSSRKGGKMSLTVIPAQRFMRLQASSGSHQAVVGTREAEPNADVSASRHLEASPSVAGGEEDGTNEEEERQVTGMLSDVLEEDEESVATAETDNSDTATIVPSASSSSSGKKKKKRGANKKKRKDRQTEGPDPVMAEEISGDSRKKTDTDQKVSLVTEAIQMASESTGPVLKGLGIMVGSSQPINSTPSHEWQRHQERDTEEVIESKFKSFRISNVRADVKQWRAQRLGGVEMVRTAEALMIDTSEEPDMDFTPKIGNWRNQPQSQPNANASFDDLFTPTPTNNDQSPSVPITPTDQHTQSDDDATPPATPKARRYGEFVFSPDTSPRIVPLFPPEVSRASSPIVELENSIIEDVPQDEYDEKMQTPELSHQSVFDSAPNSPMAILTTPTGTPQLSTASIILGNEPRLQLTPRILITNSSPPHAELPPSPPSLPAPPAHQPLKTRHSWTLLFSNTSEKAKSVAARQVSVISGLPTATAEAYSHGLVTLFTASNLHDLFGCYKALRRKIATAKHRPIEPVGSPLMPNVFGLGIAYMPDDNNFHFFREGVKPMWEDPMCASGGKLMLAGHPDKMDHIFFEIMLDLIGNILEDACPPPPGTTSQILGAVLSKRPKHTRLELWLGGLEPPMQEWTDRVEEFLERRFKGEKVYGFQAFGVGVKAGGGDRRTGTEGGRKR